MDNASYLLDQLRKHGHSVRADSGRILVGDPERLPAGWKSEIHEYREELLKVLSEDGDDQSVQIADQLTRRQIGQTRGPVVFIIE